MATIGPQSDGEIPGWCKDIGIDGLVDVHVHFLPKPVMDKVWAYFDNAETNYGAAWPVRYRFPQDERVELLRSLGVGTYAPLVYPHKPGMAEWLNGWVADFAASVPEAVPTATFYPEPGVEDYLDRALRAGAREIKMHVQVGKFDPRDPLLHKAWGMIADARVPAVVHCGHGPLRGEHTGLSVFEEVLRAHPSLTAVLAHAGMPEYVDALRLADEYENVHLDTTMVGTPFAERMNPLPHDWPARLAAAGDKIVLGTDFPNIPYDYATQLRAIASWADADDRLGVEFLRRVLETTPARLLGV